MGNSHDEPHANVESDFPIQRYLNQGLSREQVLQIRSAFNSYEPVNGVISLSKYRQCVGQSGSKEMIDKLLGNKETMNFDQFFKIQKEVVSSQLKTNPNIELDISQVQPSFTFCPYAKEVVKN